MTAGQSAFVAVKFSGAAKAKRRRHHRQARFCPCPEICYSAPKICSWQPSFNFALPGGRLTQQGAGLGFKPDGAKGGLACAAIWVINELVHFIASSFLKTEAQIRRCRHSR